MKYTILTLASILLAPLEVLHATDDLLKDGIPILDTARVSPTPAAQMEELAINHPDFQRAMRMTSKTRGSENKWSASVRWLTKKTVKTGDVLLIVFSMRCVKSAAADGKATATVAFGTATAPGQNSFVTLANSDQEWKKCRFAFVSKLDHPRGHPSVQVLQQWGFYEPSHWRPRAALFRKDWSPKPNGQAFLDLVFKQWWTDQKGTTDGRGQYALRAFLGDYEVTVKKGAEVKRELFALPKGGRKLCVVLE